jgi:hypothetical protein
VALDRGGQNIVLDLTEVGELCADAMDVLATLSETLRARGGLLWLAAAATAGAYDLVPVSDRGLAGAEGLCASLDVALARERKRDA